MDQVFEALRESESGLFSTSDSATPECRLAVTEHLKQIHAGANTMLKRVSYLEHEVAQLQTLPPPPPIGAEEIAAQQDVLENLVAKDEVYATRMQRSKCMCQSACLAWQVLRRQLGALVHEKGALNQQLQQKVG